MKRVRKIIVEIVAFLLIVLFTYTATSKLFGYSNFKFQLTRSPFITGIAGTIAWLLPMSEIIIACMLCINRLRQTGLYASFFMMLVFTGYIYAMLHFSPFLPCSCGGVLAAMSWQQHFYFNIFFIILALTGIVAFETN